MNQSENFVMRMKLPNMLCVNVKHMLVSDTNIFKNQNVTYKNETRWNMKVSISVVKKFRVECVLTFECRSRFLGASFSKTCI